MEGHAAGLREDLRENKRDKHNTQAYAVAVMCSGVFGLLRNLFDVSTCFACACIVAIIIITIDDDNDERSSKEGGAEKKRWLLCRAVPCSVCLSVCVEKKTDWHTAPHA